MKVAFEISYREEAETAIQSLLLIKEVLPSAPIYTELKSCVQEIGGITTVIANPLTTDSALTVESVIDTAPKISKADAKAAQDALLGEVKSLKKPGRPKKVTNTVPEGSLLVVADTDEDIPEIIDLDPQIEEISVDFDKVLLAESGEEAVSAEDEIIEDIPVLEERSSDEPDNVLDFDTLKNRVMEKVKEAKFGMPWLKYILKENSASKLSDLSGEAMQIALENAVGWLADKEAEDLLG